MSPPYNPDRARAHEEGDLYYMGRPCRRCASRIRYVSNYACVSCAAERDKGRIRTKGTKRVAPTYEGIACRKCGGTLRYEASGHCVPCRRRLSRAAYSPVKAKASEGPAVHGTKAPAVTDGKSWLAATRAAKTARQRQCAYGVAI